MSAELIPNITKTCTNSWCPNCSNSNAAPLGPALGYEDPYSRDLHVVSAMPHKTKSISCTKYALHRLNYAPPCRDLSNGWGAGGLLVPLFLLAQADLRGTCARFVGSRRFGVPAPAVLGEHVPLLLV